MAEATAPLAINKTPAGIQLRGRGKKPRIPNENEKTAVIQGERRQRPVMRRAARPSRSARSRSRKTWRSP